MKIKIIGFVLIISGVLLFGNSSGITGNVVYEDIQGYTFSLIGLAFILGGLALLVFGRESSGGLETLTETRVLVSRKALSRVRKDSTVKNNFSRYLHEIEMIKNNPSVRPKEKIGEFLVSPQGKSPKGLRVAWHYDAKSNTLYVDDFLYHESEREYVGKWNRRAADREIIKKDYESSGYVPLEELEVKN